MRATGNNKPSVSIIVPCRDEKDYIESVHRLRVFQEPPPGSFEVIVADGISNGACSVEKKRISSHLVSYLQVFNRLGFERLLA